MDEALSGDCGWGLGLDLVRPSEWGELVVALLFLCTPTIYTSLIHVPGLETGKLTRI